MSLLNNQKIALLATDGFEDSELQDPLEAVKTAGADVVIVSLERSTITGKNGTEIAPDATVDEVSASDFDRLILPGGVVNPDTLRINEQAVKFVRDFFDQHKPVAAICHAPWLLIEAGVVKGRTLTSWPSLKTDLENAGAKWVDEPVVVDHGLVTSRKPDDIPEFNAKMLEEFSEGKDSEQNA